MKRLSCALVVAGLSVAAVGAQSASTPEPSATLDFLAVSQAGQPAADLRADELALRIDGRPRRIESLQWISLAPPPVPTDAAPRVALPPPFGSNVATDAGRALVLVIDDDSFRPGRETALRGALNQFLRALSARDRVALVTVPYGGLKVDFTTDHSRVTVALTGIVGQAPADQTGSDLACRTRRTLESLTGLLASVRGDGPTTLLFFSSSLAGPRRDAAAALGPGMCELTTAHFEEVGSAASVARTYFYVVLPEDVEVRPTRSAETIAGGGFSGSDDPRAGLEHLAGVTGAYQLPLATTRDSNLLKVAAETSGYYLLAFAPEPADRNGERHRVDLRSTRDQVTLRTRPTMSIPRTDVRSTRARVAPRDMLREVQVFRDLPLRAVGYASQNAAGEKAIKIVMVVEAAEPGVTLAAAAAGLFDPKGRLAAQWTANAEELATPPVVAALVVPPGEYRLRMAATDTSGRAGSADYEVSAELTSLGSLTLSGLVLGLSRGGGFVPKLQFGKEPVALAYLEIYGDAANAALTVAIEVAMTPTGAALVSIPAAVQKAVSDPHRRIVTAAVPVGALPPGDAVIRAVVTADGQSARVSRTLRKTP